MIFFDTKSMSHSNAWANKSLQRTLYENELKKKGVNPCSDNNRKIMVHGVRESSGKIISMKQECVTEFPEISAKIDVRRTFEGEEKCPCGKESKFSFRCLKVLMLNTFIGCEEVAMENFMCEKCFTETFSTEYNFTIKFYKRFSSGSRCERCPRKEVYNEIVPNYFYHKFFLCDNCLTCFSRLK